MKKFSMFVEHYPQLSDKQKLSLYKKSSQSDIPVSILEEVYRRGLIMWDEDSDKTQDQYAFDRVNSFISGGFAAELDEDLKKVCWKGYQAVGMKKKNGKNVPNCVPVKESENIRTLSLADIAKKHGVSSEYLIKQFSKGVKVEQEHTKNKEKAGEIARDHLKERPDYYTKLSKVEKSPIKEAEIDKNAFKAGREATNRELDKYPFKSRYMIPSTDVPKKQTVKVANEQAEPHSTNKNKPNSRFVGSSELVAVYKKDTPGQEISEMDVNAVRNWPYSKNVQDIRSTTGKDLTSKMNRIGRVTSLFINKITDPNSNKKADMNLGKTAEPLPGTGRSGVSSLVLPDGGGSWTSVEAGSNSDLERISRDIETETPRNKLSISNTTPSRPNILNKITPISKTPEKSNIKEATYQGKTVPLNKLMKGDVKKSKVYVDPDGDGKAQKVNFGDKNLSIKKDQPARKRSYCARSGGIKGKRDVTSANYWSRRAWNCNEANSEGVPEALSMQDIAKRREAANSDKTRDVFNRMRNRMPRMPKGAISLDRNINELSNETLGSYAEKAEKQMLKIKSKDPMNTTSSDTNTFLKRKFGVELAKGKMGD